MPLFEVVLDSEDQQEVRFTDRSLVVGDVLEMQGVHWEVVREFAARDDLRARYQCRRAEETRRSDEEIRQRADATRARLESPQRSMVTTAEDAYVPSIEALGLEG
jgi:hypothetical protein